MVVAAIPQAVSGVAALGAAAVGTTAALASSGSAGTGGTSSGSNSSQFYTILGQYNVRSISPTQFTTMIQQLRSAGAVSDADFRSLSQIRTSLDQSGANPDEPIDLVQFFNNQLAAQQQKAAAVANTSPQSAAAQAAAASLATIQSQVNWVQKFAAVQSSSEGQPLNTVI